MKNKNYFSSFKKMNTLFEKLLDYSFEGMLVLELDGTIIYSNQTLSNITGFEKNEVINTSIYDYICKEYIDLVKNNIKKNKTEPYKIKIKKKDGSKIWVLVKGQETQLFGKRLRITSVFDLSDTIQKEKKIKYLSNYDYLTGLYNRKFFIEYIKEILKIYNENGYYGGLLFIDIDNFKEINDVKGHSIGDILLINLKERLLNLCKKDKLLARMGGDEFVIFLDYKKNEKKEILTESYQLARKIQQDLSKPFKINGNTVLNITVSIGVAFVEPNMDIDSLLKHADIALYKAKNKHKNSIMIFNERFLQELEKKVYIKEHLSSALKEEKIFIVYQPKVYLNSENIEIVGYEALLRWKKNGKYISPACFIPIAEESQLIIQLGEYVLEKTCKKIKEKGVNISINISPRQFENDNFIKKTKQIISSYKIDPSKITFEITENTLIKDIKSALAKMEELTKFGINFSIDDFGTGFSSFEYLKKLPIQELKIDKSFVKNVEHSFNDYAIIEAITKIGHIFNLSVVAEGIENENQLNILKTLKVDYFQGFYFYKPGLL